MSTKLRNLKPVLAATGLIWALSGAVQAQHSVPELLEQLKSAEPTQAKQVERALELEWSKSGSTALDLLLRRGRDAMEAEDYATAVGHFSALIDHAPDFAEGYHARATAYYSMDKFGPSIVDLQQALALNPDNYNALFGLGIIFSQVQDYARAAEAFGMVLDLHPNHENATDALKQLERRGIGRAL